VAVREGDEAFRRLDRTLTEIDTEAQRSAESVKRIDTSTREQEARSAALAFLMETMAAGAEENAATAQQLSASNEEQAAALQSMALSSGDLRDIARRLDDSVALFKLDSAESAGRSEG
jgi:methyl-accepting chemotaxis protein